MFALRHAALALFSCAVSSSVIAAELRNEPVSPIVPPKVELDKKLFFDPRLSKSGFISCNSCHNLSMCGADNIKTSIGDRWQEGPINSPTVLNSSLNTLTEAVDIMGVYN